MKEIALNANLGSQYDFASLAGKNIEIKGMIQNLRILSWGAFLILRTPKYTIQTVIDISKTNIKPEVLMVESAVKITGIVKEAKIKDKSIIPNNYEIDVENIEVISKPSVDALPVDTTKKELNVNLDINFDLRPLTLRHVKERAIFKIAACVAAEFGNYLSSIDFTRIHSPKIQFGSAEGGANVFKIDYFEKEAFLGQSPQFYKQMMVGVFGRVFEVGPVFRAEKHDTSRHLNEYISLDFEMGFIDSFYDLIQVESNTLKSILEKLRSECKNEIELLEMILPEINKITCVKFDRALEIIHEKYQIDFRGEIDLSPEAERMISEHAKSEWDTDFIFVTHYPSEKRPFYTMDDPENPERTLSFDLIFRGVEITTGGQRLHRHEDYIAKMKKFGLDPGRFESYLQAFKFGMPPHGGLGLGLERLTSMLCGLSNIKEASLFPRDINRLTP